MRITWISKYTEDNEIDFSVIENKNIKVKKRWNVLLWYCIWIGAITAISRLILGWPKSPVSLFHKIKGAFFIFTNNFIDLDILNMSTITHYWLLVVEVRSVPKHLSIHKTAPQQRIIWPKWQEYQETSQTLLTRLMSHNTFSIYCTNLFLCFSCVFIFLEITKHNMLKMLHILFHLQY